MTDEICRCGHLKEQHAELQAATYTIATHCNLCDAGDCTMFSRHPTSIIVARLAAAEALLVEAYRTLPGMSNRSRQLKSDIASFLKGAR